MKGPASGEVSELAPPPDFRCVGLSLGGARLLPGVLGWFAAGAVVGASFSGATGGLVLGATSAAVSASVHRVRRAALPVDARGQMTIVPWGILVESRERLRVLRWPGIRDVQVTAFHGRDGGTPTTRYSLVTVQTDFERIVGRAPGALSLDRLSVHLHDYAQEASHRVVLDLAASHPGEEPAEANAELVILAAREHAHRSAATRRVDRRGDAYRTADSRHDYRDVLGSVLRDRVARDADPRPFAAALAAELDEQSLVDDLLPLVQSPFPLLAAFAKVAAARLGAPLARTGTLEEVEPFLHARDAEALAAWRNA